MPTVDIKGNDGRAARRRKRILQVLGLGLAALLLAFAAAFARVHVTNKNGAPSGRRRGRVSSAGAVIRSGRDHGRSSRRRRKEADNDAKAAILSAEYHLINVRIPRGSMKNGTYDRVHGLFCPLDFSLQKQDPTAVPMAKDLLSRSARCDRETRSIDLKSMVANARAFDDASLQGEGEAGVAPTVRSLPVAGFVFHESRSGSTLVSNILAALWPAEHRVHSEATPPIHAVRACEDFDDGETGCNLDAAAELLRDVVYLMGRTADPRERRQFFKVQSIGTTNLQVFTKAFPTVPWIFIYRHPVQVMMSYWRNGDRSNSVCLRGYNSAKDSALPGHRSNDMLVNLTEAKLAQGTAFPWTRLLTKEQYCAESLASFCEAAISEYRRTSGNVGRMINYDKLKESLLDSILPHHFHLEVGDDERRRAEQVFAVYSKRRRGRLPGNNSRHWVEDSSEKEDAATDAIKKACQEFLWDPYNTLESLAAGQKNTQ